MLPWLAAALVLGLVIAGVAIIAGIAVWNLKPASPLKVSRFLIEADGIGGGGGLALSPDGSRLVYAARVDGVQQLFLRDLNQTAPVPIRDTNGAGCPFFSPDGNWVGFFAGFELKKVLLSGGSVQTLCNANFPGGASWGLDDTIIFAAGGSQGLMRVSASGGEPKRLTKPENESEQHSWPEFLPDGKAVLFTIFESPQNCQVAVLSLETENIRPLINGTHGRFAPSGHLIFGREDTLWAVPFDSEHLDLKGEASPIVEGVLVEDGNGWAYYALANDGSLAYLPEIAGQNLLNKLIWVDRNGKEEPLAAQPNNYMGPRISPDGTKVAMTISAGETSDLWIWDTVRETMTRLTFNEASYFPLWYPDGKRVAFDSGSIDNLTIYWKAADGTGEDEKLNSELGIAPFSWSKNGKTLVTMESSAATGFDIGSMSMEGDHEWKPLLQEKYFEGQPDISPDGRWMAYMSDESGEYEIYVRPFPDVNKGRMQISTAGGDSPLWSPDGRELFYRNGDEVMAVTVETEPTFKAGKSQTLFSGTYTYFNPMQNHPWDISRDGKRFLMIKESQSSASAGTQPKINIVLNWFEELKQRVPVK